MHEGGIPSMISADMSRHHYVNHDVGQVARDFPGVILLDTHLDILPFAFHSSSHIISLRGGGAGMVQSGLKCALT